MATKKYKPTTPARRHMSVPDFAEITKKTPERSLIEIKKKHAGRNSYGKITVRHHGGGNKQKYRIIDFPLFPYWLSPVLQYRFPCL